MKRTAFVAMFGVGVLSLAMGTSPLFGQDSVEIVLDFNTDPSVEFPEIQFLGNAEWRDSGGVDSSGYLSVTDALDGQSGAIIFPDLGGGDPIQSFRITADLRVGGGTNGGDPPGSSPADGFSFNFVRPDDPLANGDLTYAGIGTEASLPEEGSRTGLGIGFDEWQSGATAPDATPTFCGTDLTFDCVGMSIRIDNELVKQIPFPTRNGAVDDTTSLQTGMLSPTVDQQERLDALGWAKLEIELAPTKNIFISYKDEIVYSDTIDYEATAGQLVFAGRTGGANSNHHIDNITVQTNFTGEVVLGDFNADGVVDTTDFGILTSNFNTSGLDIDVSDGDMDFNRRIDLADFVLFREAFAGAGGVAAAVPEPHSFLLAAFGLLSLGVIRRRRGKR